MTDSKKQTASKTPSHIAYHVRNRDGGEGIWTRIGGAWTHADATASTSSWTRCPSMGASHSALLPKKQSEGQGRA
jgi:hypothetical protein